MVGIIKAITGKVTECCKKTVKVVKNLKTKEGRREFASTGKKVVVKGTILGFRLQALSIIVGTLFTLVGCI